MQLSDTPILSNEPVGPDYRMMTLQAPAIVASAQPGQFIHLRVPNLEAGALRRPFSICDAADGRLDILYKQVGRGTSAMAQLKPGDVLNIMGPLGHGRPGHGSPRRRERTMANGKPRPPHGNCCAGWRARQTTRACPLW